MDLIVDVSSYQSHRSNIRNRSTYQRFTLSEVMPLIFIPDEPSKSVQLSEYYYSELDLLVVRVIKIIVYFLVIYYPFSVQN